MSSQNIENKMIERLNVNYEFEDNDASYSSFGWDFQANAGIYLFLHYIDDVQYVAIESKYQDIEMVFSDKTLFAQAKALQNEITVGTETAKLRDAMVSLAKVNAAAEDLLLYISNLRAPIDGEKDKFRNSIIPFSQCDIGQQSFIKRQVKSVVDKLEQELRIGALSEVNKRKKAALLDRLTNFNYDRLSISSIYPYIEGDSRYKVIKEKMVDVFVNKMSLEPYYATGLIGKVLTHWQQVLKFNSSIADKGNERKFINKKDFIWTIIAIIGERINAEFIENTLSSPIDSRLEEDCKFYLERDENLYHERFDFMNRVMQGYEKFKKTVPRGQRTDEAFIASDEWQKYSDEFDDVRDGLLKEYITKCYMFKIINRNNELNSIAKGVGLCISKN